MRYAMASLGCSEGPKGRERLASSKEVSRYMTGFIHLRVRYTVEEGFGLRDWSDLAASRRSFNDEGVKSLDGSALMEEVADFIDVLVISR